MLKGNRPIGKGFTLVELMIVLGLFGLLLSIAIPNLIRFRQTSAAYQAARGLVSDIELTKNLSISLENTAWITFPSANLYEVWYNLYYYDSGGTETAQLIKHKSVDLSRTYGNGVTVSPSFSGDLTFQAMGFIQTTGTSETITVQNGNINYKVTVEKNGKSSVSE